MREMYITEDGFGTTLKVVDYSDGMMGGLCITKKEVSDNSPEELFLAIKIKCETVIEQIKKLRTEGA